MLFLLWVKVCQPKNFLLTPLSLCRDEAEMEYLKIAQDLEMYGVNYFAIRVSTSRNTPWELFWVVYRGTEHSGGVAEPSSPLPRSVLRCFVASPL